MRTALTYFPESPGRFASRIPRKTPRGLAMHTAIIVRAAHSRVLFRLNDDLTLLKLNFITETETAMLKIEACRAIAMKTVRAALSLSCSPRVVPEIFVFIYWLFSLLHLKKVLKEKYYCIPSNRLWVVTAVRSVTTLGLLNKLVHPRQQKLPSSPLFFRIFRTRLSLGTASCDGDGDTSLSLTLP